MSENIPNIPIYGSRNAYLIHGMDGIMKKKNT